MPVNIDGTEYFTLAEIAAIAGVSRQTVYRWMADGKIPNPSHRQVRNNRPLFTQEEAAAASTFAGRVDPIDATTASQLSLFKQTRKESGPNGTET